MARSHSLLRDRGDRGTDVVGDRESDRIVNTAAAFGVVGGEPVQQRVRGARPVHPDEQPLVVCPRDMGDRGRQARSPTLSCSPTKCLPVPDLCDLAIT